MTTRTVLVLTLLSVLPALTLARDHVFCWKGNTAMSCPAGGRIVVSSAMWGRSTQALCPGPGYKYNPNCRPDDVTQIMKNRCDGKPSCEEHGLRSLFPTDPCHGHSKFLEVEYQCDTVDSSLCTPDWEVPPTTNRFCYRFENTSKSWSEAKDHCEGNSSFLVEPMNQPATDFVNVLLGKHNLQSTWIGLSDDDHNQQFNWTSNKDPLAWSYWAKRQPSNVRGQQHCVESLSSDRGWNVQDCTNLQGFICQRDASYAVFRFPTNKHNYAEASKLCISNNMMLPEPRSTQENKELGDFASRFPNKKQAFFLGITNRSDVWRYQSDNEEVKFTSWSPKVQPGDGKCVVQNGLLSEPLLGKREDWLEGLTCSGGTWIINVVCAIKVPPPTPAPVTEAPPEDPAPPKEEEVSVEEVFAYTLLVGFTIQIVAVICLCRRLRKDQEQAKRSVNKPPVTTSQSDSAIIPLQRKTRCAQFRATLLCRPCLGSRGDTRMANASETTATTATHESAGISTSVDDLETPRKNSLLSSLFSGGCRSNDKHRQEVPQGDVQSETHSQRTREGSDATNVTSKGSVFEKRKRENSSTSKKTVSSSVKSSQS